MAVISKQGKSLGIVTTKKVLFCADDDVLHILNEVKGMSKSRFINMALRYYDSQFPSLFD